MDKASALFGFREQNVYEIYSLNLSDGKVNRLTNRMGVLTAPEFSPDGQSIIFVHGNPNNGKYPDHAHGSEWRSSTRIFPGLPAGTQPGRPMGNKSSLPPDRMD